MKRILIAVLALAPSLVSADVAPPPGYVESCTVEKQCRKSEEGDSCRAWHGEPDKCRKLHASDGFVYRCRTSGASVWSEVYCRPRKR